MRLLRRDASDHFSFTRDLSEIELSSHPYAILSHTWGSDEDEVTLDDIKDHTGSSKAGYQKIQFCIEQSKKDNLEYFWVDTCCIDKRNNVELSRALISMFRWYSRAEKCYVYLSDVADPIPSPDDEQSSNSWHHDFRISRWFRRGWTLQELLAPPSLDFFSVGGVCLGTKTSLGPMLCEITTIPIEALHGHFATFTVEERLRWHENRETREEEDMVYSLFGIFNVSMPVLYGEGRVKAQTRLQKELSSDQANSVLGAGLSLQRSSTRDSIPKEINVQNAKAAFSEIASWLYPSDPWTNHGTARQQHEPRTCDWVLQCGQYTDWKAGPNRHLWLYGKPGCGKTILCSTIIDDLIGHCRARTEVDLAIFYFSFSDDHKQSYNSLLLSLVAQLGWKGPALSVLQRAFDQFDRKPEAEELEDLLHDTLQGCVNVYLVLDALDESPEEGGMRQLVLDGLGRLAQRSPTVKLLVTSRESGEIRDSMDDIGAEHIAVRAGTVDADIRIYLSERLAADRKLRRLSSDTSAAIHETILQKSDGMFRWASLQLQELKKLKVTQPSFIKKTLNALPLTLDETYKRVLDSIAPEYHKHALTLLYWLAYAKTPRRLIELRDAVIIDVDNNVVNIEDRGHIEDVLNILSGLVVVIQEDEDAPKTEGSWTQNLHFGMDDFDSLGEVQPESRIRLAHFTVKEYLESDLKQHKVGDFHLDSASGHQAITKSCIAYIMHYSSSIEKATTLENLTTFPLLQYAAQSWYHHSLLHRCEDMQAEVRFLKSPGAMADWLKIHLPDMAWQGPSERRNIDGSSGLYYAAHNGLMPATIQLLEEGEDVNARRCYHGSALQAASAEGHVAIVRLLLHKGANIDAVGGYYGTPLQAASFEGRTEVVRLLLDSGADANAIGGRYGFSLQAASCQGHLEIAKLLLDAGADVVKEGGVYGNSYLAAALNGRDNLARLLLDRGAVFQLEALDGLGRSMLHLSAIQESTRGIRLGLEHGLDVNMTDNHQWTALHWAAYFGSVRAVTLLLSRQADTSLCDWQARTPYDIAIFAGSKKGAKTAHLLRPNHDVDETFARQGRELQGYCDCCEHRLVEQQHHCTKCFPGYDLCFRCVLDVASVHPEHGFTLTFSYREGP